MSEIARTPAVKKRKAVVGAATLVAVLAGATGFIAPVYAEETAHGRGKVPQGASSFPVVFPNSGGVVVPSLPTELHIGLVPGGMAKAGRTALNQPGCTICLSGAASVTMTGSTGSFHVDRIINNRGTGYSGPLSATVVLAGPLPTFGQTITGAYTLSSGLSLSPLQAGYQYAPVDSGNISFFPSFVPVGVYWQLLFLSENVSGTWYYADWVVMSNKVSCNGSACSLVATPSCSEDADTMCLLGGRYRVTGRWKNQYAGGAQANLSKVKLTDVTGAFWIADASTYEFMIRVNTATDNGRAWMSILTFTDVEFWVAVTDVTNGQSKEYHSDPGNRTLIFDPSTFVYP